MVTVMVRRRDTLYKSTAIFALLVFRSWTFGCHCFGRLCSHWGLKGEALEIDSLYGKCLAIVLGAAAAVLSGVFSSVVNLKSQKFIVITMWRLWLLIQPSVDNNSSNFGCALLPDQSNLLHGHRRSKFQWNCSLTTFLCDLCLKVASVSTEM